MSGAGAVRDIADLGAWSNRLLVAQALLSLLAVAIALLHGPGFSEENGSAAYALVALLQFIVFIVAGFVVLRWIYFATANAHAFGAQGLRCGPWLAVGSFFIPIANLVMPFQSMRDVWKASVEPRDWEVVKAPPLLGWWWLFWLAGNITGIVAFRLADVERYPDVGRTPETLMTLSDASTFAASLLLAAIVRQLTALQQARLNFV